MIGFSLIFYTFNRDTNFSDHLYGTYLLLYGQIDDSEFSYSEKIMLSLILLLLSVILLNLLISIMGDSFRKIQEKSVMTDAQTRLDMIMEANILRRRVRRNIDPQIGYLIFCGPSKGQEDEDPQSSEWEGEINIIKRVMRQNEHMERKRKQEMIIVKGEIEQLKEGINKLQAGQDKILDILEDLKCK